jgi:MFS family permease
MSESEAQRNLLCRVYPWVAILLSSAFLFYKYILQVSPSIMTNQLMRAFHVHGAGLGNLAAMQFYTYMITQVFVGVLLDRFGTRLLASLAIAICATGAYLFGHANGIAEALVARGLMGVGVAFATVSYMKIASVWFRSDQFAFIGGLLATMAMLGAVFGEAPLSLVVQHYGWRETLIICAFVGYAIAIAYVLIVRDKNPARQDVQAQNYKIGFSDIAEIVKNPQNWLLTFYSGLAFSPVAVFGGLWGVPFIKESHHLSSTQASFLVSTAFIGLAVGGPVLGFVSDRLGSRRKVMAFGSTLSLVTISLIIYITTLPMWLMVGLLFLFGFGTGAFMLGFALGKDINKLAVTATVIALINTGDAIFGAITEPMIGKFLDMGWGGQMARGVYYFSVHDYRVAFLVLPVYLLIALTLILFIKDSSA